MKFACPNCHDVVRQVVHRPRKRHYRWYEFSGTAMFCPHCGAELEMDRKGERWALLVLPLLVFLPTTLLLPEHSDAVTAAGYVAWALALLGMLMLYLKRRIVVVDRSAGQGAGRVKEPGE